MAHGPQPLTALQLFRGGLDTDDIRRILKISEAEALQQLTRQRGALLGLPDPYSNSRPASAGSAPRQTRRVAYAGRV